MINKITISQPLRIENSSRTNKSQVSFKATTHIVPSFLNHNLGIISKLDDVMENDNLMGLFAKIIKGDFKYQKNNQLEHLFGGQGMKISLHKLTDTLTVTQEKNNAQFIITKENMPAINESTFKNITKSLLDIADKEKYLI